RFLPLLALFNRVTRHGAADQTGSGADHSARATIAAGPADTVTCKAAEACPGGGKLVRRGHILAAGQQCQWQKRDRQAPAAKPASCLRRTLHVHRTALEPTRTCLSGRGGDLYNRPNPYLACPHPSIATPLGRAGGTL